MKEISCMFCGHRSVYDDVRKKVNHAILDLIDNHGVTVFYSGNKGLFDDICSGEVRDIKKIYKEIKLCWIAPYFTQSINNNREFNQEFFDEIIVLDLNVHYKQAITERNRYMVRHSDYMICYVNHDYGGAYDTMKYAEKMGVKIIRI